MKKLLLALLVLCLGLGGWMLATGRGAGDLAALVTGSGATGEAARILADAEAGDAAAQFRYASWLLDEGNATRMGIAPDPAAGIGWLRKAAGLGDDRARLALALMHIAGAAVEKNDEAAGQLFLDMAEDGNVPAQAIVADMFQRGWAVPESQDMAVRFYRQSAKGGSAQARNRLWQMLRQDRIPLAKSAEIAELSKDPFDVSQLATVFQITLTQRYLDSPEGGAAEREREAILDASALFSGLAERAAAEAGFDLPLIVDAQTDVLFSDVERLAWRIVLERHDDRTEMGGTARAAEGMSQDRIALANALADRATEKWEK